MRDVGFRPARRDDCRRVWEWRNDPVTRDASFDTSEIPYDHHERWFTDKVEAEDTRIFIVAGAAGREVGYVRFTIAGDCAEISVSIDRGHRGKGYGPGAIRSSSDHLLSHGPVRRIVARVKASNFASLRAFQRVGFVIDDLRDAAGVPAYELSYEGAGQRAAGAPVSRVLFRVDCGRGIGLGHLRRCRSLATALEARNIESVFLTNEYGACGYADGLRFRAKTLDGIPSWSADDREAVLAMAHREQCEAIVVDSHEVDGQYLGALLKPGLVVIARDDLGGFPFPCQMVINGNADARELPYASSSGDTRFLLGPEYAVLPPEFWEPPAPVRHDGLRNVLVILGGGDACRVMPRLLVLLDGMPEDFTVTAVLGPFAENRDEVTAAAARTARPVDIVPSPESVRDLMLRADLAISGAGQTLYELARVGCPTIAVRMAANQEGQLRAFAAAGTLWPAGSMASDGDLSDVPAGVRGLLADTDARAAMSAAGQRLVDGAGAWRVAGAIAEKLAAGAGA